MAESAAGGGNIAAGGRYPYYYGPEGRLVLVDSALEAVNRGSTTIGIKTPAFALLASHIKPVRPSDRPGRKDICNRWSYGCNWLRIYWRHTAADR